MTWKHARRLRQITQLLSFLLYVYLMFSVVERRIAPPLADIFFRLDPLSAAGAMLAGREWIPRLGLTLITILVTILIGRVWCGWICPLGTLLEWLPMRGRRRRAPEPPQSLRKVKYFLLIATLAGAVLGNLSLLVFDPIAIFTRTFTTVILPGIFYSINAAEAALYRIDLLEPALDWFESWARGPVIPSNQPIFQQNILLALLFGIILSLNLFAHRFWCRYLCPLGALLGLLSRIALFRPRIGSACTQCSRCAQVCRPAAIETRREGFRIMPSECTVCLDCLANCKPADIHFRATAEKPVREEYDLSRRQALVAIAGGAGAAILFATDLQHTKPSPWRIRPPGASDEDAFLSACLRCSQCMKICPTTALQPALGEAGLIGLWTPILIPRNGYCDYGCNACGQVCPSGAIPLQSLEDKRQSVIGKASIDRDRCLPWASNQACIVCEEMCPIPEKAIRLEEVQVSGPDGQPVMLQRPFVVRDLCIGCGICEYKCPLQGDAAIRVHAQSSLASSEM
ncbi:MAG: 4Fe-4S binding protein [Anaerolineales bacterium]|nr:4Fe-4S binding protein [Anaerolineales bacterium]